MEQFIALLVMCFLWGYAGFVFGMLVEHRKILKHWKVHKQVLEAMRNCSGDKKDLCLAICEVFQQNVDEL